MSFVAESDDKVVDRERSLSLRLAGGRLDENYAVFRFASPDCEFSVPLHYSRIGVEFVYPEPTFKKPFTVSCSPNARIELGLLPSNSAVGHGDPASYAADVLSALACFYSYGGRYRGPVYLLGGKEPRLLNAVDKP
jgi:hypothetical protein